MKHSTRAKQNMTRQLNARMSFLQHTLMERLQTVKKIKSFAKYNLPGYTQTLSREITGINKTKRDISRLRVLIQKRYRAGQIYRVR